jgi:hypothetical protein
MAVDTPTGQQAADAYDQLAFHHHSWRAWEQGGLTTQSGYVDISANPSTHYTWRLSRSTTNKTKPEYPV